MPEKNSSITEMSRMIMNERYERRRFEDTNKVSILAGDLI